MRSSIRRSPWAVRAMSAEANAIANRLDLQVIGPAPWVVRHPGLVEELRGGNVDVLVLKAAKELSQ